ncbi:MAG: hypothetical protein L0H29_07390, partial [Sinobacteraceae bacterium]|nr:hypothetical protein [Nevskiaceae bacterium]
MAVASTWIESYSIFLLASGRHLQKAQKIMYFAKIMGFCWLLAHPFYGEFASMLIGVPKEIKTREYRVGLTPAGVRELVDSGHKVLVQTQAGAAIDFGDDAYRA